jgi:cytochrome c biogenesis protein CcmG/thiol:disulfide interchange protein DsbE
VKKFVLPVALFALIGLMLAYALAKLESGEYAPRYIPSPLVGKPLPAFALPTLADPERRVGPADLRGRPFLLNVWASWCVACRDEHPVLVEMARRHGVPIIGLNYKDARGDALAWLERFENPYELSLVDRDGRIGIELGVYGVPETFLIDAEGTIRYKHIGPIGPDAMRTVILPKLAELRDTPAPAARAPRG